MFMNNRLISINKKIFSTIFIFLVLNPINCKSENIFTPYRLFFGFKQQVTNMYSTASLSDRGFTQSDYDNFPGYSVYVNKDKVPSGLTAICIKNRSDHTNYVYGGMGFDGNACREKDGKVYGYDAYPEPPAFSFASLEFAPNYIFWRIGFNLSLVNRKLQFTIVDYPTKNKELDVALNATSISIPIFLNIGDKNLGKDGKFSLRFGAGPNLTYISQFDIESDDVYDKQTGSTNGVTVIIDVTFLYTVLKLENTTYKVKLSHPDFKNDEIYVNANDSYLGIFYYF